MTDLQEYYRAEERLRQTVECINDSSLEAIRSLEILEKENAKLRELVRDMWCCISHIGEYDVFYYDMAEDGCGMSCTVNGEHCCADKLHDRMRELGVEVSHDA